MTSFHLGMRQSFGALRHERFIFVLTIGSNRHHVFVKTSHKEVQLAEVGPRFEMKRTLPYSSIIADHELTSRAAYEIRQGTIEQNEADKEWVLAHYSRTAKKRRLM